MLDGTPNDPVRGRVTRIASEPRRAARGDYLFRGLELTSVGDAHKTFLIIPQTMLDYARPDLYEFPLLCWEGAEIVAYDLEFNNRLADGTSIYAVKPDSDLLLEPFRPVSVTDAVEAAFCIRSVDVRNRVSPSEPFRLAKGKLIHDLFDHLVSTRGNTSGESFDTAYRRARPVMMAALPGSRVSAEDRPFEEEVRRHFRNLARWIERNGRPDAAAAVEIDGISSRWGLKGRADALFNSGGRETILELKSGRFPAEEHQLQLYAYSLLFEDDGGDRPEGRLFYSETGRSEAMKPFDRWPLLQGRNRVVSLRRMYTLAPAAEEDEAKCPRKKRCFNRADCHDLHGSLSPRKEPLFQGARKDYYCRWFRLLSLELWETEGIFARALDPDSLAERVAQGITTRILDPAFNDDTVSPDEPSGGPWRSRGHIRLVADGSSFDAGPGDLIIIHRGDPASRHAVRARVTACDRGTLHVKLMTGEGAIEGSSSGSRSKEHGKEGAPWYVDAVPFTRAREASRQALYRFLKEADPSIVRLILQGDDKPGEHGPGQEDDPAAPPYSREDPAGRSVEFDASAPDSPMDLDDLCFAEGLIAELNEDQEAAVRAALESDPYYLVHGPPGTGKTRVLARLVRICLDRGERVLIACPTNVALDRLLVAMIDLGATDLLRIGGRSAAGPELSAALERLGRGPALFEDLCRSEISFSELRKRVSATPLIGAVAYQCATHPVFIRERFDRVVIDEAGQLDEPACLGPLALAGKFVLGGDHLQLPPVVRRIAEDESALADLERSLFERLISSAPSSRVSRLRMQYRMNVEIQEIPSRLFYDGALFPSPEAAHRRMSINAALSDDPAMRRILDPNLSVVFVDIDGADRGKARPEEARFAADIVRSLLASGVPEAEIGLITPYRVQQSLIREFLAEDGPAVAVDTVDRFQGGEREVIILSLARSDGVTSFLADRKRLNVSLSRARCKLILLGHGPVLESHPLFQSLLSGLERVSIPAQG